MSTFISDSEKVDFLLKKVGYELSKTDLAANKTSSNEVIASPITVGSQNVWLDPIPTNKNTPSSVVEPFFIRLVPDTTSQPGRAWIEPPSVTNRGNWISQSYGNYGISCFSGLNTNLVYSTSTHSGIQPNNGAFFIDYAAGVINFAGVSSVTASFTGINLSVYVSGFRYIGAKGSTDTARKSLDLTQFSGTTSASGFRNKIDGTTGSGFLVFQSGATLDAPAVYGDATFYDNVNISGDLKVRGGTIAVDTISINAQNISGTNGSFTSSLTVGGTEVSLSGHTHPSSAIMDLREAVEDIIGSGNQVSTGFLRNGSGLKWTYTDNGTGPGTLSVGITGVDLSLIPGLSGYFSDNLNTSLVQSTGIDLTYDANLGRLLISVTGIPVSSVTNFNQSVNSLINDAISGNISGGTGITLAYDANNILTINANVGDIVNDTIVRTSGAQTISGIKTFTESQVFSKGLSVTGTATFNSGLSVNSQRITELGSPQQDSDAATKGYVDGLSTGLDFKPSVRFATTGNIARTSVTSTGLIGTAGASLPFFDGVAVPSGSRVLLKNQTITRENGIYIVANTGGAGQTWTLNRAPDADSNAEVTAGMFVFVEEGTTNADTGWVLSTNNPIAINNSTGSGLDFVQFSAAGQIVAVSGLARNGNNLGLASEYGDTVFPFGNKTRRRVLAGPTGNTAADAVPTFRELHHLDIPSLGNITNLGAIGTTANRPIITTTDGVLTTGSFGSTQNSFCAGDDARLNNILYTSGTQTISGVKTLTSHTFFSSGLSVDTNVVISGNISGRAPATSTAATQIVVFTGDPSSTTQGMLTRTPSQLSIDIGAVVTTGNQTVSGVKTFDGSGIFNSGIRSASGNAFFALGRNTTPANRFSIFSDTIASPLYTISFVPSGVSTGTTTIVGNTSGNNTLYLPSGNNGDGTLALLSNINTSQITGTLSTGKGGTGQSSYVDGELLIGNGSTTSLTKATLTQGTGIVITNGPGTITINHNDTSTLNGLQGGFGIESITVDNLGHITAIQAQSSANKYLTPSGVCAAIVDCTIDGGTF